MPRAALTHLQAVPLLDGPDQCACVWITERNTRIVFTARRFTDLGAASGCLQQDGPELCFCPMVETLHVLW